MTPFHGVSIEQLKERAPVNKAPVSSSSGSWRRMLLDKNQPGDAGELSRHVTAISVSNNAAAGSITIDGTTYEEFHWGGNACDRYHFHKTVLRRSRWNACHGVADEVWL